MHLIWEGILSSIGKSIFYFLKKISKDGNINLQKAHVKNSLVFIKCLLITNIC